MEKKGDEERKERGQSMAETEGPREISENPLARLCMERQQRLIFSLLPQFLPETAVFGPLLHVFSYVRTIPRRTEYTRREEREKCMKKRESDVRK